MTGGSEEAETQLSRASTASQERRERAQMVAGRTFDRPEGRKREGEGLGV